MDAIDELAMHLREFRSAPFLFVGSGISRRYLKLPDWEGLLKTIASLTDRPYGYFATSGDGNMPAIASAIADHLHEKWWTDDQFEDSRLRYSESLTRREGPFKAEVARLVQDALDQRFPLDGPEADELAALKKAVVDGLITTNYDKLLERLFPEYRVYVGQDELLFTDPQGIGEIYKIHGDADQPESLVVTEEDFQDFNTRNPYLAAKLLTIFVERPVIFLGYSLRDPDVTQVLSSIATVLTQENLKRLEGNLILVEWDGDLRTPDISAGLVTAAGFTIPVTVVRLASFLELFTMLGGLEHKFSAPVLRRLKEHVYDLVRTNDPQSKLFVADIDSADAADIDVVFGVGIEGRLSSRGYRGIKRVDLLLDALQPKSQYNALQVVEDVLPELLRQTGITPIYRYLRESGLLTKAGGLMASAVVDDKIRERVALAGEQFVTPASTRDRGERITKGMDSITALASTHGTSLALQFAQSLPWATIDREELRTFLMANKSAFSSASPNDRANWTRLVGLYDYLQFGRVG